MSTTKKNDLNERCQADISECNMNIISFHISIETIEEKNKNSKTTMTLFRRILE